MPGSLSVRLFPASFPDGIAINTPGSSQTFLGFPRISSWRISLVALLIVLCAYAQSPIHKERPVAMILQSWERTLLRLAHEDPSPVAHSPVRLTADPRQLASAYRYCEALTARCSRTFFAATWFLPARKRRSIRAIYAFCRRSDDLVDYPQNAETAQAWSAWRQRALSPTPPPGDPVAMAWTDTRLRYRIPLRFAEQLLDGIGRDLRQIRYATFEDLTAYAYGVASTVGLMSMHVIGFSGEEALPYAIRLGVALQLTNILRDVGEDWRIGRVYLPQDELGVFGLDETDVARGRVDSRWRGFMRFQIERNRRLYAEARPGIALLNRDGRLAVSAAAELYSAILEDIEARDYDVFRYRAHTGPLAKLRHLLCLFTQRSEHARL